MICSIRVYLHLKQLNNIANDVTNAFGTSAYFQLCYVGIVNIEMLNMYNILCEHTHFSCVFWNICDTKKTMIQVSFFFFLFIYLFIHWYTASAISLVRKDLVARPTTEEILLDHVNSWFRGETLVPANFWGNGCNSVILYWNSRRFARCYQTEYDMFAHF